MLWPSERYAEELQRAVESGEIPMSRLDDAVERILLLKQELGLFGDKQFKTDTMDGVHDLDRKIAQSAMTIVRDRKGLLPCKDAKNIAIIGITDYDDEKERLKLFKAELEKGGAKVELCFGAFYQNVADFDLFIYCTFCHQHKPCGFLQIVPDWQTGTLSKDKTIVVAFGSPYLINASFPTVNTAIAVYSDTTECIKSVAKGILGELPFKGKLPVKLQEIF